MGECMAWNPSTPLSSPPGAAVIDANVLIGVCAREPNKYLKANAALATYGMKDYHLYAPSVIVSETLYILCGKLNRGDMTAAQHAAAIQIFDAMMQDILPAPNGEASLIRRAEQIRAGYGCSRSADGLYIALAEELAKSMPTELVTFDLDLPKQAANHAPTIVVNLITI